MNSRRRQAEACSARDYWIFWPKAFMLFESTVRGYSPEPQSLNEPKSLYQFLQTPEVG